jgi:hypothetical protein
VEYRRIWSDLESRSWLGFYLVKKLTISNGTKSPTITESNVDLDLHFLARQCKSDIKSTLNVGSKVLNSTIGTEFYIYIYIYIYSFIHTSLDDANRNI